MEGNTRLKQRIRRKNMGFRRAMVLLILMFIIVQLLRVLIPVIVSYSRYTMQAIKGYYLGTKNFYFKSDKLTYSARPAHYEAEKWSGNDDYEVNIQLNSIKNSEVKAQMDVNYKIELTYSVYKADGTEYPNPLALVEVDIDKDNVTEENLPGNKKKYKYNGTIYVVANNKDNFKFTIKLKSGVVLDDNDYITVNVKADSTYPFVNNLEGNFTVSIGNLGISYKIEDDEYDPYFRLIVTNTLDEYKVDTAFSYQDLGGNTIYCAQGSTISVRDYLNCLNENQRANCHSARISLSFDPHDVLLDTASGVYLTALRDGNIGYANLNGSDYVNFVKLDVAAEESKVIRFYKVNAANNYSYQSTDISAGSCIVTVTIE